MYIDLWRAIDCAIQAQQIVETEKHTAYGEDLEQLNEVHDQLDWIIETLQAIDD